MCAFFYLYISSDHHTEITFKETKPVPAAPRQNNMKVANFNHIEVPIEDEVKDEILLDVIGREFEDFFPSVSLTVGNCSR